MNATSPNRITPVNAGRRPQFRFRGLNHVRQSPHAMMTAHIREMRTGEMANDSAATNRVTACRWQAAGYSRRFADRNR